MGSAEPPLSSPPGRVSGVRAQAVAGPRVAEEVVGGPGPRRSGPGSYALGWLPTIQKDAFCRTG